MNTNLMMLLPFLMGMKNGGNNNLADMMSALSGNGQFNAQTQQNPMFSMLMNIMNNKQKQQKEPAPEPQKDKLEAIRNLSGEEVTEALKILLNSDLK